MSSSPKISAINLLEHNYVKAKDQASDINEHINKLYQKASCCKSVLELGTGVCRTTWAFAKGLRDKNGKNGILRTVDIGKTLEIQNAELVLNQLIDYKFYQSDSLTFEPKDHAVTEFDIIFIDTWHVYGQMKRELAKYSKFAKKYIILHDTTVDADIGESVRMGHNIDDEITSTGFLRDEITKGIWPAVEQFLNNNKEWKLEERLTNCNGLAILVKV